MNNLAEAEDKTQDPGWWSDVARGSSVLGSPTSGAPRPHAVLLTPPLSPEGEG